MTNDQFRSRVAAWTVVVCLLAALAEAVLGCTSTGGVFPADALTLFFFIGPYCLLALLAWKQRGQSTVSVILFVAAVALAAWGLYVSGVHSYRYHTEPKYRRVQHVESFIVSLLQWGFVLLICLGFFERRFVIWFRRTPDS